MLHPKALDHLALKVTEMESSLRLYHHVLGREVLRVTDTDENGGGAAVLRAGAQKIDLFSRPDFVSADKDKPIGMDPLCQLVDVTSAQEIIDHLQQADVEIFWEPVERQGSTSVYVYDPDGVRVELRLDQTA